MTENVEIPETMLNRVARIIATAEECAKRGNTADAEAAFAKADQIMAKYAIDMAMIAAKVQDRANTERENPISATIPFVSYGVDFGYEYESMLGAIARHCRTRVSVRWSYSQSSAVLVGFPADVEYCQMLWNSVYFAFVSKLDPKWDPAFTADQNIKILKEAGWKWGDIAVPANEHGFANKPNDGRLKAAYRRQCKAEGVEPTPHTQRHGAYRAAYAEGFESAISTRLWRMKRAMDQQVQDTPGSAVALRDRMADVDDAFFEMFPNMRPMTDEEREEARQRDAEADAAEEARRAKLTPAQRDAEDRREESRRRREERRWQRENARLNDDAGRRAGHAAGSSVDLGGTKVSSETSARGIGS